MSELANCPFCGSAETALAGPWPGCSTWSADCDHCGAELSGSDRADAIARWNRRAPAEPSRVLGEDELREALERPTEAAQLPALIMANIEDVPGWQDSTALVTAHCHARVLHEDFPAEPSAGWRGIETAPRFGLLLLSVESAGERRVFVAQGDQHPTGWRWITCVNVGSWDALHGDWSPVAWQPLPAPGEAASPPEQPALPRIPTDD